MVSHSPGHAVVRLASAEEASRATRELSRKLLRGSSISLLVEGHTTGVPIDGGKIALSRIQMPLEEDRPPKKFKSLQKEEASNNPKRIEQTTSHVEPQAKKKSRTRTVKHIEFFIGGLPPETKAYQVKAFLDSHQM